MLIFIVLVMLGIIFIDAYYHTYMPNFVIRLRIWLTYIAILLVCIFTLFSRKPTLLSFLVGSLALLPHLLILVRLINHQALFRLLSLPIIIIASITTTILLVFSQSLISIHNGYPSTFTIIPVLWWVAIAILALEPKRYYSRFKNQHSRNKILKIISISCLPLAIITWGLFTQFIFYKANALADGNSWCLRETDHTHMQSGLWLSPRKMLFENKYKGSTSAYLLLKLDDKSWTHHWSFKAMNFIENENNAFLGNLTFYKNAQAKKPC